jgi:radical SAM-linked protein
LQYQKTGWIRFLGHLDLQNVFQRAFRRLRLPLVFSQGFSPHPKMSMGPPLPLGYESDAEFLDVQLFGENFGDLPEKLNTVLPEGLFVVRARQMGERVKPISAIAEGATYVVTFSEWPENMGHRVSIFLARPEVWVERVQKGRRKRFNLRAFVSALDADAEQKTLRVDIRFRDGRAVRVREVLTAVFGGELGQAGFFRVRRTALWLERGGKRLSPMEV